VPWRIVCITAIISFSIATIGIFVVNGAATFQLQSAAAINTAAEGIDALQSIKNVNRIRFREDPKKCWLTLPQENVCSAENEIKSGYYALHKTTNINQWELVYTGSAPEKALDLDTEKEANGSYLVDAGSITIAAAALGSTDFYRMIKIEYITDEQVTITSIVQWKTFSGVQTVNLPTFLTNYLNIDNG